MHGGVSSGKASWFHLDDFGPPPTQAALQTQKQPEVNLYILKSFYLESNNLCKICILWFWQLSVLACAVTAVFLKDSMEHGLFRMFSRVVGYSCSFSSVYPLKQSLCPNSPKSLFLRCKLPYKAASWSFWCKLLCPASTGMTSQTSNCCHCDRLPQQIYKQDKQELLWREDFFP